MKRSNRVKKSSNTEYYLAAAAALLTLLVYLPALQNGFVDWDDNKYIYDNPYIRSLDAAFFKWAFWSFHAANWHPLTWISHAVDYAVWGLNPLGHHLPNILLHGLNTFLIVVFMIRLLDVYRAKHNQPAMDDRMVLIAAGTTGLLFGIHPMHVESVAWASERKDVLCALFFLLSVMTYTKYAMVQGSGIRDQKDEAGQRIFLFNRYYLVALGFFVLALMSKPMAVTLPVVLLILDWHPFGRMQSRKTLGRVFAEKLPFAALSLASSILTLLAQESGDAIRTTEFAPLSIRIMVAAKALVVYLGKMIWPLHLVPLYPYPNNASLSTWTSVVPLILAAGITAACVLILKKQKLWLAVWSYYVVTLIPVLGIVQVGNQSMADRYAYLPSIGPFLIAGLATAKAWRKIAAWAGPGLRSRIISAAAALLVVVFLSSVTVRQLGVWKSGFDLWSYVMEQEPGVKEAYNMRGLIYANRGEFDKAIGDFDRGLVLDPDDVKLLVNRAFACVKVGQVERGLSDLQRACGLGSDFGCNALQYFAKGGR